MLGATMWFAIVIGLVATVLMETAASFGRAGVHAAADHALDPALNDAVADYQNELQRVHASGAAANPLERTFTPDANGGDGGPRFTLAYTVVPTTVAAPSCAASGREPPSGADAIAWLQCSDLVRESRMSLHVTVRVLDAAGGAVLAQREQYVTLRLFGEPPYSAVVGRTDGAAADPAGGVALTVPAHEGDVGGGTVSGTSPPPAAGGWPAGGTLIHVRYECRDGAGHCANAAPPDPDAALRANAAWANGNMVQE